MMHWYGWDGMGTFGWVGMLLMTLFWFGVIALLIWGIAGLFSRGQQAPPPPSSGDDRALTAVRERFARGEITEQEYRHIRRTLESTGH